MASTAVSMAPKAVMITTGTVGSARLMASRTSRPSMLFIRRSVTTTSAGSLAKRSMAAAPLSATSGSKPASSRSLAMVWAMSTTSSMMSARLLDTSRLGGVGGGGPEDGHGRALAVGARQIDLTAMFSHDA